MLLFTSQCKLHIAKYLAMFSPWKASGYSVLSRNYAMVI